MYQISLLFVFGKSVIINNLSYIGLKYYNCLNVISCFGSLVFKTRPFTKESRNIYKENTQTRTSYVVAEIDVKKNTIEHRKVYKTRHRYVKTDHDNIVIIF